MSIRNCTALFLSLSALLFLFGCGSSSPKAVAPPTGGFSSSNLNGTYTFSSEGTDSAGAFFAIAGSLTANGSGGITGGAIDVNDEAAGADAPNLAIASSSSYSITADGRGSAKLNVPGGTVSFDFVLTSSSHGLITRFDSGGSGSGTLDLQGSVTLAGPYTFSLTGLDVNAGASIAEVGTFTVSGSTITGIADIADGQFGFASLPLSGSIALGSGSAPGTATLTTTSFGTYTFDVYTVDSGHLKFVETDGTPILVGDAFTQQTSIPSGQLVFTAAGLDGTGAPMAMGGYMTSNGTSTISDGFQDVNDGGSVSPSPLSFSGSFTPVTGGRSQFTLNTFFNGASGTFTFAAYPSTGGIQLLEIDSGGNTVGAAFAQTNTTFASAQGYGLNVSASNLTGGVEEDDIAEFTATSGNLTGLFDQNDEGSFKANQTITGSYVPDSTNDGRGQLNTSFVSGLYYTVDGSTILFLETDSNQVGLGSLGVQSSMAQAAVTFSHIASVRPKGAARAARRHK